MVLLDTDILIEFFKGNDKTNILLREIGISNSSISSITLMELLVGVRNKKELNLINKKLQEMTLFQISENISSISIELIEKYTKSHGLLIPDALIAATALEYNIPLLTYNHKDFRYIDDLDLYKF